MFGYGYGGIRKMLRLWIWRLGIRLRFRFNRCVVYLANHRRSNGLVLS